MPAQHFELPLTIAEMGQILTQGLMLYRRNWKTYGGLAAKAYGWFWVPVYGWSRYVALKTAIAPLAFVELSSDPLSPEEVYAGIQRNRSKLTWLEFRTWWQIILTVTVNFILAFILAMALYFGVLVIFSVISLAFHFNAYQNGIFDPKNSKTLGMILGMLIMLFTTVQSLLNCSQLFYAELELALEPEAKIRSVIKAAKRWNWRGRWKLLGFILSTFMISLPFIVSVQQLLQIIFQSIRVVSTSGDFRYNLLLAQPMRFGFVANCPLVLWWYVPNWIVRMNWHNWIQVSYGMLANLILVVTAIAVLPLWQAIKATLYYRIRCKTEGFDLHFTPVDKPDKQLLERPGN